jgi:hypothetical protein
MRRFPHVSESVGFVRFFLLPSSCTQEVAKAAATAKLESPVGADADDQQTLRNVVEFYHKTLKESPEALRYLESRGLTHGEMIGHFQLGFANRKLGLTLPDKNRKTGADLRGHLQKLGILRESGHEHMNGSVVFPIFSLTGDVLGMYGRKITPGLRVGTPMHLYLPGPHRGVWNEEALVASKEIILCESIIDALTFWCAGFRNVTASYGVNGFTDDHKAAFQKHGIRNVWIAYDRDEAGDTAAERLKEELGNGRRRSIDILRTRSLFWVRKMATRQTPLRTAFQKDIESNVEYGEAVFALLKRKAENQLELIAPAHSEQVVEFWRALLAMQTVQVKLGRERHRLSVLDG